MTDSSNPDNQEITNAIMQHEGVDEREATHRWLERASGQLRPAVAAAAVPEKTIAERIQALRTASEVMHADADGFLAPIDGLPDEAQPTKNNTEYRCPFAMGELFTAIADHAGELPAPVLAWAITVAETIIETDAEMTKCRFCGCTDERVCPGGCGWASPYEVQEAGLEAMDGDVCTACTSKAESGIPLVPIS